MRITKRLGCVGLFVALCGVSPVLAQGTVMPSPKFVALDNAGVICAGCKLHTYAAGSTTPLATFPTSALTPGTENANPTVLDSAGRATIFLSPASYKFVLGDATDATIWTQDNISAVPQTSAVLDVIGTAGEDISGVVYLSVGNGGKTAGRWYLASNANAYSSTAAVAVGVVLTTITGGLSGSIRLGGPLTTSGVTAGTVYYIGTGGALISSLIGVTNQRLIGVGVSATVLIIEVGPRQPEVDARVRVAGGRLTLTTGLPVTTADVAAATTIYYTPYTHNLLSLFTSTSARWATCTFTELSLALGADTANKNYDLFAYFTDTENPSTCALERTVWTNDSTRATALAYQDGVLVRGDLGSSSTRRYLGTYRTTGVVGQTEDSAAKRLVWNYYNRVPRLLQKRMASTNYTYTTATWRQANADATQQVEFVIGWAEVAPVLTAKVMAKNDTGTNIYIAIGLDTTTTPTWSEPAWAIAGNPFTLGAEYLDGYPAVGRHYAARLEYSTATGTTTWYGENQQLNNRSSLYGWIPG